jgi:hypothetical protein
MERPYLRKYPRIAVNIPVEYTLGPVTDRARAMSLGGGGLFLGIAQYVDVNTELSISFRPAKHLPVVTVRGRVRHQIPERGIGIEFVEIDPDDQQIILRLIHHRMGERRKYPRAPLAVQVETGTSTLIGFSKDIGPGGMFVETKEPVSAGSNIRVRFHLGDGGSIVMVSAIVLYIVEKLGMGVHFTDISTEDKGRIEKIVQS